MGKPSRENIMGLQIKLSGIKRHSLANGPGVRYVIFMQGCPHHCKGCQNPETWDPKAGQMEDTDCVVSDVIADKYLDGVTLSGGDPFFQGAALLDLARRLKEAKINLWAYSGWTFEELLRGDAGKEALEALSYIDVLVDGPFVQEKLSTECIYRGSTNQRLIDLKKSLAEKKAVEVDKKTLDFGL